MKYHFQIVVAAAALLFFSCNGSEKNDSGGEVKEYFAESEPVDTAVFVSDTLSDSARTVLTKFFSSELIAKTESFLLEYSLVQTDSSFELMYEHGMSLIEDFLAESESPKTAYFKEYMQENPDIFLVFEELQTIDGQVGPIHFTCAAECTMLDYCFDLKQLEQKALQTSGTADDEFIALLIQTEGEYGYAGYLDFKQWDKPYWDYGGTVLLGDGILLETVRRIQNFRTSYDFFKDEVALVHADVLEVLEGENSYEYTVEEVLAEYNKIFKLNYFSGEELEKIQKQYDRIKNKSNQYQFDCENGDCVFG